MNKKRSSVKNESILPKRTDFGTNAPFCYVKFLDVIKKFNYLQSICELSFMVAKHKKIF